MGELKRARRISRIEVLPTGHVHVQHATVIEEDGEPIAPPSLWRRSFNPGEPIEFPEALGVTAEELAEVQAHAALAATPERVAAHKARVQAAEDDQRQREAAAAAHQVEVDAVIAAARELHAQAEAAEALRKIEQQEEAAENQRQEAARLNAPKGGK